VGEDLNTIQRNRLIDTSSMQDINVFDRDIATISHISKAEYCPVPNNDVFLRV
jgi:hypothetical protein